MVERREREQGAERRRREPLASPGRWPKMIIEFKWGKRKDRGMHRCSRRGRDGAWVTACKQEVG